MTAGSLRVLNPGNVWGAETELNRDGFYPSLHTTLKPVTRVNYLPERDADKTPILECIDLGISFGGLKAVDNFNIALGRTETARLKAIVARVDPDAIMIVSNVHEAFGEGFGQFGKNGL